MSKSISNEIAFLDFEETILRDHRAVLDDERVYEALSAATKAAHEKQVSVHIVDYGEVVLFRCGAYAGRVPLELARELVAAMQREISARDEGWQSDAYRAQGGKVGRVNGVVHLPSGTLEVL